MKTTIKIIACLTLLLAVACEPQENTTVYPRGEGFFILNEGNYLAGNGSVSFYSFETGEVYNDLFGAVNGRALGDIPSFMAVEGDRGFIVVNNSGTIEAVDLATMESIETVTGLVSPRQMVIYGNKGYISSLQEEEIRILDLDGMAVSDAFEVGATSEAIVISDGRLFAAHWSGGSTITVTDIATGNLANTISVGLEPESMVLDRYGKLWILCTGGWQGEEVPRLVRINVSTLEKEAELEFGSVDDNPSSLTANAAGDTLYYLHEGVRRMPVIAEALPPAAFIQSGDRLFYKLMAGPRGIVAVTDAIDYQQKGDLLIYNSKGELIDSEQAGIIPGFMLYMND